MKKVIIFSLLLLCLLAYPGSAWEMGFETSPDDAYKSGVVTTTQFDYIVENNTTLLDSPIPGTYDQEYSAIINLPVTNYLTFSCKPNVMAPPWDGAWPAVYLTAWDSNNVKIIDRVELTRGDYQYPWEKIEVIRVGSTDQFEVLSEGVSEKIITAVNANNIAKFQLHVKCTVYSKAGYKFDDFSTDDSYILGFDNPVDAGSSIGVSYGLIPLPDFEYKIKLYYTNGTILASKDITGTCGQTYFDLPMYDGNIKARITGGVPGGTNYIFYTKDLTLEGVSSVNAFIDFDKNIYSPGNQVEIFSHLSPYGSGYSVIFKYGDEYKKNSITQEDQTFTYTIPSSLNANYVFAYIIDSFGAVVASDQAEVPVNSGTPELKLDKDTYTNNETMYAYYTNVPLGADLVFNFYKNGAKVISYSYEINDIVGYYAFPIGVVDADSVVVNILSSNGLLASDSAKILIGNYFLSGKVYDAVSSSPIADATVFTSSFTVFTDDKGYYNHSISPGFQNVTISAAGYQDLHTSVYITNLVTSKNFYLAPSYVSSTGSSVYGLVSDFYNGSAVGTCYVKLRNGSVTYSALTTSKGFYSIEQPDMQGTWTITASKSGYDTYSSTVLISGDTYKGIRLVPNGGAAADPDSSGSSGSTSTDRPDREAAKESLDWLEGLMPNLIKLVVVVFVLALIGWRF